MSLVSSVAVLQQQRMVDATLRQEWEAAHTMRVGSNRSNSATKQVSDCTRTVAGVSVRTRHVKIVNNHRDTMGGLWGPEAGVPCKISHEIFYVAQRVAQCG